jgi:hypothetical protein
MLIITTMYVYDQEEATMLVGKKLRPFVPIRSQGITNQLIHNNTLEKQPWKHSAFHLPSEKNWVLKMKPSWNLNW